MSIVAVTESAVRKRQGELGQFFNRETLEAMGAEMDRLDKPQDELVEKHLHGHE
jgi:hypothetical protein